MKFDSKSFNDIFRNNPRIGLAHFAKCAGVDKKTFLRHRTGESTPIPKTALKYIDVLKHSFKINADHLLISGYEKHIEKQKRQQRKQRKQEVLMFDAHTAHNFGLKTKKNPFAAGRIDLDKVLLSTPFKIAVNTIIQAVETCSFLLLKGVTGNGKSTILTAALNKLEKMPKIKLFVPSTFDAEDIDSKYLQMLVLEAHGKNIRDLKIRRKKNYAKILNDTKKQDITLAFIIDEAHRLPKKTMIALKQFWESYGVHSGNVAVILLSQPIIDDKLSLNELKEVEDRLEEMELAPLKKDGEKCREYVKEYIIHKLAAVGLSNLFTDEAIMRLTHRADTVQELNVLCAKAMVKAAQVNAKEVTEKTIYKI